MGSHYTEYESGGRVSRIAKRPDKDLRRHQVPNCLRNSDA